MSEQKKSEWREKLFYQQKNGYDRIDAEESRLAFAYCEGYKQYLNAARTEREAVREAIAIAEAEGFVPFQPGMALKAGDRVYLSNRGKALMLAVIGEQPLSEGCVIAGAHVDCPRLDLKQVPLYEDTEMAYLKTHYYGGIKKYQWVTIPLELHGVVALKSGELVDVVIGKDPDDPQFVITDLLPHLAADQMKKTLAEGITGEGLNLLIGSMPYDDEGKDRVKLAILSLLYDDYGITEEDFLSAELVAVPAFETRDVGLDRSLIGGYGHDDRVCAYAELRAILDLKTPRRTAVCILADKEEIGSEGVSGMKSRAFETFMEDLCAIQGVELRRCFEKSFCISADVCNAFDPNFPEVSEKRNEAKINYGMGICKYTGARGKSGTSDASAEVVAHLRRLFAENGVVWQLVELGKVDQGGGGTIAKFMAERNIDTIDAGVPVLSMHAPFEVVSKLDCWMTYKGVLAAYQE
ncbi:MAG: aminopeptidase [Oscillospiraceae bacterium]|nr:aminopeptidase [Oscillospiraceae bacterium]